MKSILIVEDNEAIIKGLKYLLEQEVQPKLVIMKTGQV